MSDRPVPRLHYDRRAPEPLLAALSPEGELHALVELALDTENATKALDLQLRADPRRTGDGHATLYIGLTKALDLEHRSDGRLRVRPQTRFGPGREWDSPPEWTDFLPLVDLVRLWPEVIVYAQDTIDAADARYTRSEGGMQAVLSNAGSEGFEVIDREAVIGFDARSKAAFLAPIKRALSDLVPALRAEGETWAREGSFGDELDALAIDREGRVLIVEVKPASETTAVGWTPAQVFLYYRLFSAWVEQEPDSAPEVLEGMLQQRVRIGLARERDWTLRRPLELVSVIAIGGMARNRSVANRRMRAVADGMKRAGLVDVEPQVWQVDESAKVERRPLGGLG